MCLIYVQELQCCVQPYSSDYFKIQNTMKLFHLNIQESLLQPKWFDKEIICLTRFGYQAKLILSENESSIVNILIYRSQQLTQYTFVN